MKTLVAVSVLGVTLAVVIANAEMTNGGIQVNVNPATLTDDQLSKLQEIISGLQDIHRAAKAGIRDYAYVVADLEEDYKTLGDFIGCLPRRFI